ncbi:hypothetical protein K4S75_11130 [Staphylococcus epidermidis]|nr:hypothetical protein [Staphylococcus epidermidis]
MFNRKKKHNNNKKDKDKLKQAKKKQKNSKSKKQKISKEEKRAIKERRKAYKKNNTKYDVEGGIGGDKDPRTKRDVRTMIISIIGYFFIILSIFGSVIGTKLYWDYQKNNTTKLGSKLEFKHSDGAQVKITEVWTDKKREVTVAKIGYPKESRKKLSNSGSSYKLYLRTSDSKPNIKMSYGILNGEGDGYLFIKGKQKDQPYNVAIENTIALTTDSVGKSSDTSSSIGSNEDDENIETAISSMNKDGSTNSRLDRDEKKVKDAKNKHDFIKLIINPYSESTKVYKGSFLDASGNIDYSKVVSQTSVESTIKNVNKDIKASKENLKRLNASKKEFEKRVKEQEKKDKKDKKKKDDDEKTSLSESNDDKDSLEDVKKSIKEEENTIKELEAKKKRFEDADFTKESFGDMQEKAKIY